MDLAIAVAAFLAMFALLWALLSHGLPKGLHAIRHFARKLARPLADRYNLPWRSAKPYVPVLLVFIAGSAAMFVAGDWFFDLVEELQRNSPLLREADQLVWEFFRDRRTEGLTTFFTFFTILGTPVGLGILAGLTAIYHWIKGRWRWTAYLVLTTLIGGLMNVALKHYFTRPRPDLAAAVRHASGTSFPSGHAMGSIIVFGALSYLAIRSSRRWVQASGYLAAAITIVLAIALSRVYLGVHWISDIAAGLAVGALWVLLTTTAYEAIRGIRLLRSRRASPPEENP